MKVTLIRYTPEPERACGMAAALTHSKAKPEELENMDDEKLKKILAYVIELGHTSVVEHASFTFAISGVSRALTHQLVRHRIASYSQQSQRYVNLKEPTYVTPPSIERNKEIKKIYDEFMKEIWNKYNELLNSGIPTEDARYVLPNATTSNIIVTMNARTLLSFFELRCCMHAQWEIRKLAWKMLGEVKKVAPTIFKNAGPPCRSKGICPEKDNDCPLYPEKKSGGNE
ncbi:MAG: FAD-dependent thymidylate synthase [Thermoplasmata archaeon]|nr:MAG: FAD-dependent thymidylate synthase [Thermoplasmata archaeon]